jgi:YD repeat-containing protein
MLPRKLLSALSPSPLGFLLLAIAAGWGQSPQNLFDPHLDLKDSVSIRQRYEGELGASRVDYWVRAKDSKGLPLRMEARSYPESTVDSAAFEYTWNENIPANPELLGFVFASRFILSDFDKGVRRHSDTSWSVWDPVERTVVTTSSSPMGSCRWADSAIFDARNRLISHHTCQTSGVDTTPYIIVFHAGYERETDSVPRWATSVENASGSHPIVDSMFSIGPVNRPDTLRGSAPAILVWNAQGRLLARRTLNNPDGGDEYAYDAVGRLVREIRNPRSTSPDTTHFIYSWEPTFLQRAPAARSVSLRFVARGLLVDLPAPSRILLEVIRPDGRRQTAPMARNLPAGRSLLPISVNAGGIVRIVSASGTSLFVAPVR